MKELFSEIKNFLERFKKYFDKNILKFLKEILILYLIASLIDYFDFPDVIKFYSALLLFIIYAYLLSKYLIFGAKSSINNLKDILRNFRKF